MVAGGKTEIPSLYANVYVESLERVTLIYKV
jgi:hypothetical protein